MKKVLIPLCLVLAVSVMQAACNTLAGQQLTAREIVKKTDDKFNGEMSGYSVMSMTIVRPTWERTIEFKSWAMENEYAFGLLKIYNRQRADDLAEEAPMPHREHDDGEEDSQSDREPSHVG